MSANQIVSPITNNKNKQTINKTITQPKSKNKTTQPSNSNSIESVSINSNYMVFFYDHDVDPKFTVISNLTIQLDSKKNKNPFLSVQKDLKRWRHMPIYIQKKIQNASNNISENSDVQSNRTSLSSPIFVRNVGNFAELLNL